VKTLNEKLNLVVGSKITVADRVVTETLWKKSCSNKWKWTFVINVVCPDCQQLILLLCLNSGDSLTRTYLLMLLSFLVVAYLVFRVTMY
jgi:hypothetical protein